MSFARYPGYKDSGVEWLGAVPEHWQVRKIRWLCEIRKRIAGELGYEVLSITQQGLKVKDLEGNDGQLSMDYSKYQLVEVGDFAMNHMDLLTGYVDISDARGVTSPDYRVFAIRDPAICHDKYLLYLFQMGYKNRIFFAYGQGSSQLGRWRLPTEQFNDLPLPLPPKFEQQGIAAFLDRETTKIDELVTEQRRLIDLLKEKRQAVISHAVTKGLNPYTSMKSSGIEWLGDVPTHWTVMSLRRCLLEHRQGYYSEAAYVDAGVKLLRITDLRDFGEVDYGQSPQVENLAELEPFLLKAGDFVFARTGGAGTFGLIESVTEPVAYASYLIRFRFSKDAFAGFLRHFFLSSEFQEAVQQNIHGGVNKNIHAEDIKNQYLALPPYSEQCNIAAFLDRETAKFDALVGEAQRAIELLQERRAALISAAVTGQIDIRAFAERQAA